MRQSFWIPGKLVTQNEALRGSSAGVQVTKRDGTKVWVSTAGKRKKSDMAAVALHILAARLSPMLAAFVTMLHVRKDRRVDPDNFVAGSKKAILDALQDRAVLKNDGWSEVLGFADYWQVGSPGVLVFLDSDRVLTAAECVAELQERTRGKQAN